MEGTKKCPYCGGEIIAAAKKCKHCKQWLNESYITQQSNKCYGKKKDNGSTLLVFGLLLLGAAIVVIILGFYFSSKNRSGRSFDNGNKMEQVNSGVEVDTIEPILDEYDY
jgi:uncharacterized membrane protein YvbJ